ncbi:MAG: biotin transporter BioY [bacterium]
MPLSTKLGGTQIRFYLLSSLFAALTAVGAFIKIPLPYTPIPITLQSLFVILAGSVLGPKFGAMSQLIYLVVGLLGVPIFAHGGGPGYIFQPTFGYLIGFPVGAFVVGYIVWGNRRYQNQSPPTFQRICISNILGVFIIFIFGVTFYFLNINFLVGKKMSLQFVLKTSIAFFIPGDVLKILVSTLMAFKITRVLTF